MAHNQQAGGSSPPPATNLTPTEIIRLGIQQGHSADVILASLEAAGWVCVPVNATDKMEQAGLRALKQAVTPAYDAWAAMLAARPK